MNIVKFTFNENQEIEFMPGQNENVMVNATQMAKIFGKEVSHFLENNNTNNFINSCLKTRNSEFLNVKNREDLVFGKQKTGTFMHRVLALKFAAWLDPDFELWVFSTIDKILFGNYKEQKEATEAKLLAEKQLEDKKQELIDKYPEFIDFLELENKISEADKRRIKAIKESSKQLKLELFN